MKPSTRREMFLDAICGGEPCGLEPVTREEMFLAALAGGEPCGLEPVTRQEIAFKKLAESGGGGAEIETCTVTIDNGGNGVEVACTVFENNKIVGKNISFGDTEGGAIDNVVKNSCLATAGLGNAFFGGSEGDVVEFKNSDLADWQVYYWLVNGDGTISYYACFVRDTLITLADGTTKAVQDITYEDELRVWDFDNGCYASARPLWIKKAETADYYYRCEFENGNVLKLVGSDGKCHRVFNVDDGCFESATDCVGKRVMTEQGVTTLVSCERVDESVEYYNIITDYHMNLFAESVLTSCRLNNIYPVENMKFVKEERDIVPMEAYGSIDVDFYNGLRLGEQTGDVEELKAYVERLIHNQH